LGYTSQVEISYNGEVINTILDTRVSAENRGIQVTSDKINDFPCQIGDKLQIEIPKKEGRYKFQSVVTEQYLVEPDPIGRYYITLAIPSNIALFNDRGAYRAPFEQELRITVLKLPEYDPAREEPLYFLDQAKEIEKTTIHLLDLSVSGCGFLIRRSILKHNVEMHYLAFKGEIEINGELIPWVAVPKYEVPFTQNKIEFKRVGGQFIGMNNLDRSIINRAVLKIERDQLRKEMERKED
jgi:c-di-GMP-binding flagellar brake protein YcgR